MPGLVQRAAERLGALWVAQCRWGVRMDQQWVLQSAMNSGHPWLGPRLVTEWVGVLALRSAQA